MQTKISQSPFLNQYELAQRWKVSGRTLERWRFERRGPNYVKVGGRIIYRLVDIEKFEIASEIHPAMIGNDHG